MCQTQVELQHWEERESENDNDNDQKNYKQKHSIRLEWMKFIAFEWGATLLLKKVYMASMANWDTKIWMHRNFENEGNVHFNSNEIHG